MNIQMTKAGGEADLCCPHCGTEYHDTDQEAEAGECICAQAVTCGFCAQPFEARRRVQFTYMGVVVPVTT